MDLTCLNLFNGRDDCRVTNWAITRIILRSVNLGCCITSDSALESVTQAVDGPRDSEEKSGTGQESRNICVNTHISF